jgi:hypothetical protein
MKPNKTRAADKTVLGVSMPKSLKLRITRLAEADHRNMAQWCVVQLEKAVSELEAVAPAPLESLPDSANKRSPKRA